MLTSIISIASFVLSTHTQMNVTRTARRFMSRRPIVGGNWKCNPASASKLPELVANIEACDTSKCEVYVCPSNLHVGIIYKAFTNGAFVAPQNCNFKV